MIVEMASQGMVTGGGPADRNTERLMRANGWQPYSFKVGDKYYSYQRLDPFASIFGIAADLVDLQTHMTDKQRDNTAVLLTASVMNNLANKTWLSGLSDALGALKDPGRYAGNFIARLGGSLAVPTVVAQAARIVDPTAREAKTVLDRIRSRIPVLSKSLPAKRDVWGQPIVSSGSVGPDALSPIWSSKAKNDRVNQALISAGAHISEPSRTLGGRELSPQEFGDYRAAVGTLSRERLLPLVSGPGWPRLPVDEQRDSVSDIVTRARKDVRASIFGGGKAKDRAIPPPPAGFKVDAPPHMRSI